MDNPSIIHHHQPLVLASRSPRREFLLKQAGLEFSVCESDVDEAGYEWTEPEDYTKTLAMAKAEDVAARYPDQWIIGADTIVVLDDNVLEKPVSKEHARQMITALSGCVHSVYTGYAVVFSQAGHFFSDWAKTDVRFKTLSPAEIAWYTETSEPYDKAGGYAIQGLGAMFISHVNGSYTNVVGLPVCEVVDHLIRHGVIAF
ncbi:MAG: nucleoside triphosphate pyrophosphatase [Thermodesulfobacteriota bacterium]|nr:nucleoside triphosphate pyrophosphatase [Thermodesulfobacteriota bacterium]